MSEAKPTSGTAYNKREGYSTVYVFVPIGRGLVQEVAACGPTEAGQDEQQANADLITEAFSTYNTTGLTPSQLVERVKELEEALRNFTDGCSLSVDAGAIARAALSKPRPNTAEGEALSEADREELEAVIACLGDDAATLREQNPECEMAANMDRAAELLAAAKEPSP